MRYILASASVPHVFRLSFLQQMDNAVYTFEQLLNQSLADDDMCKSIQRCQDRALKVRTEHRLMDFDLNHHRP